ncbi:MAG TPA: D-alanyl-D-alanine carboxypeptidase, partial [Miltoncostaeaceae bacterium]|nr:D-alanyl-D-alanine carboxypeptidase [Miltoncostaeaceae bacterium]
RLRFADGRGGYLPGADAVRAPAPAAISPATETALRSIQVRLGPASAIVVRDPFGRTLIELGTRRPLSLASVTKLGTMTAALGRFPVDPGTARAVLGSSNNGLAQRLSNRLGNGSSARGARTAREAVATLGVRMNLVDGSGLDYRNRASAAAIADLLIAVREQPRFATIFANLPIAARTGTLAGRMHATTAAGRVRAKTGTLYEHPTSTLAGYVWPAGYGLRPERALVAVVLSNGIHPDRSRPLQDAVMRELTAPGALRAPQEAIAAP